MFNYKNNGIDYIHEYFIPIYAQILSDMSEIEKEYRQWIVNNNKSIQVDEEKSLNIPLKTRLRVGKDIPAGEYVLIANEPIDKTSFRVLEYKLGLIPFEIEGKNGIYNHFVVTLNNGQALETEGYQMHLLADYPVKFEDRIPPGRYKVGVNIKEGKYRLKSHINADRSVDSAYFAIYNDSEIKDWYDDDFVDMDCFKKRRIIKVKTGQYLTLEDCIAYKTKDKKQPSNSIYFEQYYVVDHWMHLGEMTKDDCLAYSSQNFNHLHGYIYKTETHLRNFFAGLSTQLKGKQTVKDVISRDKILELRANAIIAEDNVQRKNTHNYEIVFHGNEYTTIRYPNGRMTLLENEKLIPQEALQP